MPWENPRKIPIDFLEKKILENFLEKFLKPIPLCSLEKLKKIVDQFSKQKILGEIAEIFQEEEKWKVLGPKETSWVIYFIPRGLLEEVARRTSFLL